MFLHGGWMHILGNMLFLCIHHSKGLVPVQVEAEASLVTPNQGHASIEGQTKVKFYGVGNSNTKRRNVFARCTAHSTPVAKYLAMQAA